MKAAPKHNSRVLTRTARKKAGLPPPTPLFKGVPRIHSSTGHALQDTRKKIVSPSSLTQETHKSCDRITRTTSRTIRSRTLRDQTNFSTKQLKKKSPSAQSDSESSSSSDEEGVRVVWVQCEREGCGKWRRMSPETEIDQSKEWYCSMHPDVTYQSCDQPEEPWSVSRKRAFTFTRLEKGSLVWARMAGFPHWPAIVSPDPWSAMEYITEEREGCIYHIEFLGKSRSHIWIQEEKMEPYRSKSSALSRNRCKVFKQQSRFQGMSQKLQFAISEANSLLELSNEERLSKCVFKDTRTRRVKTEPGAQQKSMKVIKIVSENKPNMQNKKVPAPAGVDSQEPSITKLAEKTNQPPTRRDRPPAKTTITAVSPDQLLKCFGIEKNQNKVSTDVATFLQLLQTQLNVLLHPTPSESTLSKNTNTTTSKPGASNEGSSTKPSIPETHAQIRNFISATVPGKPKPPSKRSESKSLNKRSSVAKKPLTLVSPDRLVQTGLGLTSSNMVQVVPARNRVPRKIRRSTVRRHKRSPSLGRGQSVSPSIEDYFKKDTGRISQEPMKTGESKSSNEKDQLVLSCVVQESPLSKVLEEEVLMVEGELREIQDMLSMFTQSDTPLTVESSSGDKTLQGLDPHSTTTSCTVDSTEYPYDLNGGNGCKCEDSIHKRGTLSTSAKDLSSTGSSDTCKDVEFGSVLSELQCIEDMILGLTDQQVPSS